MSMLKKWFSKKESSCCKIEIEEVKEANQENKEDEKKSSSSCCENK